MKYNEFIELTSLVDDDTLLVQEASSLALKKIKLSTLKQYIGVVTQPAVTTPVSGAVKWYRADDITLSGTKVTSVSDKSTGNNLIPISGDVTLVSNAINNKPALKFNLAALKTQAESYKLNHLFLVYKNNFITSFNDYDAYISCRSGSNSNKVPPSNETLLFHGVLDSINISNGLCNKVYINKQPKNLTAYKDYLTGIVPGTQGEFNILEDVNTSISGIKNLCVGADAFGSGRFLKNVDIAEIIIYPFELTEAQRIEIYSYFKQMYAFSFL